MVGKEKVNFLDFPLYFTYKWRVKIYLFLKPKIHVKFNIQTLRKTSKKDPDNYLNSLNTLNSL